jgi:site-specific recombinase XerD
MTRENQHSFEDHLDLQRVSPRTREAYLRSVSALTAFHKMPAAELTNHQIQDYLLYCIQEKKLAWASCNVLFCGLKKYYQEYLGRNEAEFSIPRRPRSKQLPMILSQQEVRAILGAHSNLKHRTLLHVVYGSGLRVSEVVKLRPEHIDSSRMMIRVEEAKGRKDRYTVLSQTGLELLREYWQAYRPGKWLFPGPDKSKHISISTAQRVYSQAAEKAGITRGRGIHTLRHYAEFPTMPSNLVMLNACT